MAITNYIQSIIHSIQKVFSNINTGGSPLKQIKTNRSNYVKRPMFISTTNVDAIRRTDSMINNLGIGVIRKSFTYLSNVILFLTPIIAIYALITFVFVVNTSVGNEDEVVGIFQLLNGRFIIFAVILVLLGLTRASDKMALYKAVHISHINDINQQMVREFDPSSTKQSYHYNQLSRKSKRVNKYLLFPSTSEFQVAHKARMKSQKVNGKRAYNAVSAGRISIMNDHKVALNNLVDALSIKRREAEHRAAKGLADKKQARYGGINEYDAMVEKYAHRTTPMMRNMIRKVRSGL